MGTKSNICVYNEEKEEVIQSYCQFDSHYTNSGRTLQKHYNSAELAMQIVNLGHISSVNELDKQENVVFSYLRDYNASWDCKPVVFNGVKSIFDIPLNESYLYIYLIPKAGSELKEGWYAKRYIARQSSYGETKLRHLEVIVKQAQNYDPK